MKKYPANFCPKTRHQLLFREMEDGAVIYEPDTEKIHSLNPSAAYIWALCDGSYTIDQIGEKIRQDFTRCESNPTKEVQQILASFENLGLLENS